MEQPGGGFRGFEFDPADDVEYTFYGLGTLALLETIPSGDENSPLMES